MNLTFTTEQKVKVLEANGYQVLTEEVITIDPLYHNQVKEIPLAVFRVYKDNQAIPFHWNPYSNKDSQLNMIFEGIARTYITRYFADLMIFDAIYQRETNL
jgi:hypothetical protein